jgi:hypothetical protein
MYKGDHDMAMMASIGTLSREEYIGRGDGHVALQRSGW